MMQKYLLILISFISLSVAGQPPSGSSGRHNSPAADYIILSNLQADYLTNLYYSYIARPKDIINGKECLPYSFRSQTSPMYYSRSWLPATLYINSRKYEDIKLQYDTYTDKLIYLDTTRVINNSFLRIELNSDIIEGFSFRINRDTIFFKHLRFPGGKEGVLQDGFYEIAYQGKSSLIIKHRSLPYNKNGLDEYKYSPVRYINTGTGFRELTNKKSFLGIFGDKSQALEKYLANQRIKLYRITKRELIDLLKYYDSLTAVATSLK